MGQYCILQRHSTYITCYWHSFLLLVVYSLLLFFVVVFSLSDSKKQQQMAALSKERDALRGTVQAYKSMFDTQQQLISELRGEALKQSIFMINGNFMGSMSVWCMFYVSYAF